MCADHAVTSLAELSLVPEFRRGHGALYDALAAGRIDQDLEGVRVKGFPDHPWSSLTGLWACSRSLRA